MSGEGSRPEAFDARMRRILAEVDTSPGFDACVMQQVAGLRTKPTVDQRADVERKRELAYRRLRREAWMNVATAAGIGAAAIALIWRGGPEVTGYVRAALEAGTNPGFLSSVALAVLGIALWPLLQRFLPR